jgi:hypothetical protein
VETRTQSSTRARAADEPLRIRALEALGPLGDALARSALESGSVLVEHDVLAWEGSHGTVHAHRVVVVLPDDLHARLIVSHAAKDALSAALAAAMAERAGHAVADVVVEAGVVEHSMSGPYRDPRAGRT